MGMVVIMLHLIYVLVVWVIGMIGVVVVYAVFNFVTSVWTNRLSNPETDDTAYDPWSTIDVEIDDSEEISND